jgi:hypothetical protein
MIAINDNVLIDIRQYLWRELGKETGTPPRKRDLPADCSRLAKRRM